MIENIIMTYLKNDATLTALLGATAGNSRIFPVISQQHPEYPFLTIKCSVGGLDETLDEDRIAVMIVAKTVSSMQSIRDRLKTLLDKNDDIQDVIADGTHRILYSKLSGSSEPYYDQEPQDWIDNLFFAVKFKKI